MTKVCNYRKFIDFTQKDMAHFLGISVQSYRNKEKGVTPFKDDEKIKLKSKIREKGFDKITIDDIFLIQSSKKVSKFKNEEVE